MIATKKKMMRKTKRLGQLRFNEVLHSTTLEALLLSISFTNADAYALFSISTTTRSCSSTFYRRRAKQLGKQERIRMLEEGGVLPPLSFQSPRRSPRLEAASAAGLPSSLASLGGKGEDWEGAKRKKNM